MSKQKQFDNRLNDLFADMGNEEATASPVFVDEEEILPGWTWHCDAIGYYTSCSPEVERILGHNPSTFLGRLMTQHLLSEESTKKLMGALGEGDRDSVEITLQFTGSNGQLIPIRTKIFRQNTESGEISGWNGFAQMIHLDSKEYSPYSPKKPSHIPSEEISKDPKSAMPRTASKNLGLAIEENQTLSVSSPYSGAGKQSLVRKQTVSYPSAPGIEAALAVPIPMADKSFGVLEIIDSNREREWSQDEHLLVEEVAEQLSLAVENARLFEETQISLSRTEALFEVSRASIAFENTKELLQSVVNTITNVLPANRTLAAVCNIQKEEVTYFIESHSKPIAIHENTFDALMNGLTGWCMRERKPALSLKGKVDERESKIARETRNQSLDGSIIVVPLIYREQVFGTLTAINTIEQPDFTQNEVDLLSAMSNQVATALANLSSFQEEQRRRKIAATLSEIARVIGESLELDQIADRLLDQLANVVDFNNASLQIIDGNQRKRIGSISQDLSKKFRESEIKYHSISDDTLLSEVIETKQPYIISDTFSHPLWETSSDRANVRSWIAAPLLRGDSVIGMLTLDHSIPDAFDEDVSDLLSAIAAQAAVALHNASLYQQAQSRSNQLQTAAEVSRAASSILDPNPLIVQTVNLIRDRFGLYYVGVFLIDESGHHTREPGNWAVLRAGTGDAGRIQIERNHKLEVGGTSMVGQCIETAQPQISQQVLVKEHRFVNPLLPDTRSELALPLISRGLVTGAMTIQSTQPAAFSDEDIVILQTMADQVANALQNASLFDQTQIRAEELAVLNEMSHQLTATVDINTITRNIYLYTSRLIDTSTFFIALYEERTNTLHFPFATEENQAITIRDQVNIRGLPKYIIDNRQSLLIRENIENWMRNKHIDFIPIGDQKSPVAQSWLGVPMLAGDDVIGIINVQHKDPHHFSEQEHDLLIAIASQGAIAYQNASLFAETRQRTEDLDILNEMSRELANLLDIDEVFRIIYEYTTKLMDTKYFFIALYDSESQEVSMPLIINNQEKINLAPRQLGNGLSDYIIRNREYLLFENNILERMNELGVEVIPFGDAQIPQSWLGVPMIIGERVLGVIAVQSLTTPYLFQERHRDLLESIASQGAITIQNTRLFAQTQKQLADLTNIQETTARLSETLNLGDVVNTVLEQTTQSIQADSGSLYLLQDNYLTRLGTYPVLDGENITIREEIILDNSPITKKVIESRKPLVSRKDDPSLQENIKTAFMQAGIAVSANIPIIGPDGVIGVLILNRLEPSQLFDSEEINLVSTLANQAAAALENARLYQELSDTAEQLREIDTLKSQFLANMSHELRTPLNSIIGFSRVIMKGIDGPVTDLQQQDLSAIYNAGQHLLNMINDILDISKIEAGKMELAFDDVELPSIIESVLSTARGLVKDKPIKLITVVDDNLPILTADPTRIRQILLNLISNSTKFTDEGSIELIAQKRENPKGGQEIYLAVKDTGTGIAEEDQRKLFVPFSQVDGSPTRKVEGTGLGLSITRLLVDLHGGEIGVDSQLGEGSTFWFTLPIPDTRVKPDEEQNFTILAIDNDPKIISLYGRYLNDAGYHVIGITNPNEALENAREIKPFAITLDIRMPDFDGWKLLEELKTNPEIGHIPVVICSILTECEKGMNMGAADYLTKPILEEDLVQSIKELGKDA